MMDSSEMTAFCESDKKRILDSLTAEDLTIFKEAFIVYDKDALHKRGTLPNKQKIPLQQLSNCQ